MQLTQLLNDLENSLETVPLIIYAGRSNIRINIRNACCLSPQWMVECKVKTTATSIHKILINIRPKNYREFILYPNIAINCKKKFILLKIFIVQKIFHHVPRVVDYQSDWCEGRINSTRLIPYYYNQYFGFYSNFIHQDFHFFNTIFLFKKMV